MSADRIRVLSYDAAGIAQRMAFSLLGAVCPTLPTDVRLRCMSDVFFLWPALAERMGELEGLAPRSATGGYENRERLNERLAAFRARQLSETTLPTAESDQ
ncbi:hypothetical protein [Caulobacter segnis]|uniref:Uncharacterized protein n=1 Tax=Caulobacter segnis TaxID=88688 RepID=A0A2W5VD73_9CAUL|nr:hypothetical protein [Caulobacter segnis]PZR36477.1 MAG: hypothetical protein DI526_03310 [Caulobacter segnis]